MNNSLPITPVISQLANFPIVQFNVFEEGCTLSLPPESGFFLSSRIAEPWLSLLTSYVQGKTILLPVTGSPFDERVYKTLMSVPFGQTQTYIDIARQIGQPTAARAVGQACGRNRIPILIPCHRITAQKSLGGFAFPLEIKKRLLEFEKKMGQRLPLRPQ